MKNLQFVITDGSTGEFYCVPMSGINKYGEPTPTDNDFSFWSFEENDAYIFTEKSYAENEMAQNDLTCDGEREPVINEIVKGFIVCWNNGKSDRYVDNRNSEGGAFDANDARCFDTKEEADDFIKVNDYVNCWSTNHTFYI